MRTAFYSRVVRYLSIITADEYSESLSLHRFASGNPWCMLNLYPIIFRSILFLQLNLNFFVHTFWCTHSFIPIPRTRKLQSIVNCSRQLDIFTQTTQYYTCKYLKQYIKKKLLLVHSFFIFSSPEFVRRAIYVGREIYLRTIHLQVDAPSLERAGDPPPTCQMVYFRITVDAALESELHKWTANVARTTIPVTSSE